MEKSFTTENCREHIAHLLANAQKAILSADDPLSYVTQQINSASLLLKELSDETPTEPDYQLARAKRVFEATLREDGYSRTEAMRITAEHFNEVRR